MKTFIATPNPVCFEGMWKTATERADEHAKFIFDYILKYGYRSQDLKQKYDDGTPAYTLSVNHVTQTFDLSKGDFPLLSLRPSSPNYAIREMLWIYKDQTTNLDCLNKYGVNWWNPYDIWDNTIWECYGRTVKNYRIIENLIDGLKNYPDSRCHIIDLYQYKDFDKKFALKPCTLYSQYYVRYKDGSAYLDWFLLLRSSDYVVHGAMNQIQYIALLMMIAQICWYKVWTFTVEMVNCQIYDRFIEPVKVMLNRQSIPANPYLEVNTTVKDFFDFKPSDFIIKDFPREEIEKKNSRLKFDIARF